LKTNIIKLAVLIFLILLTPALISGSGFIPDPVYEHIQKHGPGVDVIYQAKQKNKQLKKKNFEPRGW
jgi:hypothetical protein